MNHHRPIALECHHEPSWTDAKTRVLVACETYGFPFYIAFDQEPFAYSSLEHRLDGHSKWDVSPITEWWEENAIEINDYEQALRALYPWFHGGEEMPA